MGELGDMKTLGDKDPAWLERLLAPGPVVRVACDRRGRPYGASCLLAVDAPTGRLWSSIRDLEALPALIEMVESLKQLEPRCGQDRVLVRLRFKIAIFSARFHFVATVTRQEGHLIELAYESGKVRDLLIRFELAGLPDDRSALLCRVDFDPRSLGWLANIFIRHHPEIEWGIHAGSALSVAQASRQLAEKREQP